ncbi:MAG: hypothetical protein JW989_00555 [Chlorobiaceae bacterium]|nr:hypothetical protein [Chlorobiaceae bacterium]
MKQRDGWLAEDQLFAPHSPHLSIFPNSGFIKKGCRQDLFFKVFSSYYSLISSAAAEGDDAI